MIIKFLFMLTFPLISLATSKQVDKGLPFEQDLTIVTIDSPKSSSEIELSFLLELPLDHKLNKGAPSFVGIYEKIGTENWVLTEKISLNPFLVNSSEMHFKKIVALRSEKSEIAVFSTVYHCRHDNSRCQIQGFKSKAKRSKSATANNKINFSIQGTVR